MNTGNIFIFTLSILALSHAIARIKRDGQPPVNPMINEGLFEGDMKGITHETVDDLVRRSNTIALIAASPGTEGEVESGAAIRDPFAIWPNKQLFYEVTNVFSAAEKGIITEALEEYNKKTCIKMIPRTNQKDYVVVKKIGGCWSLVGRQGGPQELSLGQGCVDHGVIVHEFMHALGFFHEQSRWDRDLFIQIHPENIKTGEEHNFKKYDLTVLKSLNTDYDLQSVMHYRKDAFSKNGQPTITALNSNPDFGLQLGLSAIDVLELQRMYNCDNTGPPAPQPVGPITPGIIQSGSRLYGHYTQYNVKDAEECRKICLEQIQCYGMTFDAAHTYSFGNCFLASPGFSVKPDQTWSSWTKADADIGAIQHELRLYGHYTQYKVGSDNECKDKCVADSKCYGMSYDSSPDSPTGGYCFLMNPDFIIKSDKPWSSWIKGKIITGVAFSETAYKGLRGIKTQAACIKLCEQDPRCRAANFYDGNFDSATYGNCFLYENTKDYTDAPKNGGILWSGWFKGKA